MTTTTLSLLDAALSYAARGWAVFPCHAPVGDGCSCGMPCGSIGKHPRTQHGLKDASVDLVRIQRWWARFPQANIGIATGRISQLLVLDSDDYKGGHATLADLETTYDVLPVTAQSLTGGGGTHYLFSWAGHAIANSVARLGPGLDVRGDGGYIIAPPSLHVSGQQYHWEVEHHPDDMALAAPPDWLVALCAERTSSESSPDFDATECFTEGNRNDRLFRLGCSMRARGFPQHAILAALHAINAEQCLPPLPEEDVITIAAQCGRYKAGPSASPKSSSQSFSDDPSRNGTHTLRSDKSGKPYPDAGNFRIVFTHHPEWAGHLWWDDFANVPMYHDAVIDDRTITNMAAWCGDVLEMSVRSEEQLRRSVVAVAATTLRDPLHEYVSGLVWDRKPRLSTWLHTYLGVDTPGHDEIGTTLICALVARALTPGCIQRTMVILEGSENIGKSLLCQALGEPWSRTLNKGMDTKDTQMLLRGCWVMEVPELDAMRRAEESAIKAFLTTLSDSYIPKYANTSVTYPRRTVFIGTVNPDGPYLKGRTGNTRFLPVLCTKVIDVDGVRKIRDQLFAEAVVRLANGLEWWALTDIDPITEAREERREVDVYEYKVSQWLDTESSKPGVEHITMQEILEKALEIGAPERWNDRALVSQIGSIVHRCGWVRKQRRLNDSDMTSRRQWVYVKK